nr:hypothetical protein [Nocardia sp. BMG111209]
MLRAQRGQRMNVPDRYGRQQHDHQSRPVRGEQPVTAGDHRTNLLRVVHRHDHRLASRRNPARRRHHVGTRCRHGVGARYGHLSGTRHRLSHRIRIADQRRPTSSGEPADHACSVPTEPDDSDNGPLIPTEGRGSGTGGD